MINFLETAIVEGGRCSGAQFVNGCFAVTMARRDGGEARPNPERLFALDAADASWPADNGVGQEA